MTPMKEDYIKIIFELGGIDQMVSNKQIAVSLNVAAGSVTEMVNKLADESLVIHKPYSGARLTETGIKYAEELVRKHRLWEVFLIQKLGIKLPDVHDEAEKLEHAASKQVIDHLDDFLGNPTKCPHGGVIPDKDGNYVEYSYLTLNDIAVGEQVTVERFIDNHDLLTYLGDIQVDLGDQLEVTSRDDVNETVTVKNLTDNSELTIGHQAAHYIFVK